MGHLHTALKNIMQVPKMIYKNIPNYKMYRYLPNPN